MKVYDLKLNLEFAAQRSRIEGCVIYLANLSLCIEKALLQLLLTYLLTNEDFPEYSVKSHIDVI